MVSLTDDMIREAADPPPHTKVTRLDWILAARAVLLEAGVEQVKIKVLAETLGVSRASFYWYFTNRTDLLNALRR